MTTKATTATSARTRRILILCCVLSVEHWALDVRAARAPGSRPRSPARSAKSPAAKSLDHRHDDRASQSRRPPKYQAKPGVSCRRTTGRRTLSSSGRSDGAAEAVPRREALRMSLDDVLVILLAGGAGERLHPLTAERAKPAVYFGGPYRIVDFTLSNCINSGLRRIFIATQYKSLSLSRHIRMAWNVVSEELGEFIELLPPQKRVGEHWYLGHGRRGVPEPVLHRPGIAEPRGGAVGRPRLQDGLLEDAAVPHRQGRRRHHRRARGAGRPTGRRFGILGVDEHDRVRDFQEKPAVPAGRSRARRTWRWRRWASTSSRPTC